MPTAFDVTDASWFPVDLNVPERRYAFLRLSPEVLEKSSFLDTRLDASWDSALAVQADAVGSTSVANRVGWLFHTSFCGSTLLGRALHLPPYSVSLREPLVLRRLGDAKHGDMPLDDLVRTTAALLSRPWSDSGSVVIKPTHAALNIASELMAATPSSRAIVLTSTLDDFLVSNLKKSADTQSKIPQLAERAVKASGFHRRLALPAFDPPDVLCAAAIQWAAQRELVQDIVEAVGSARVRVLGMDDLLADIPAMAFAASQWLSLDLSEPELHAKCLHEAGRHAKAPEASYSALRRNEEVQILRRSYAPALERAHAWAARNILPAMRHQAMDPTSHWALK